ncbi:SDR family oxidoreductase [Mucilaginibacter sp. HMF5004]|uniref:SDR family NAD(P)-dependent oxidoreductase n=1 Tax=Mucilaginibacter rivuli TaxID=2857527 RepID=UPI001C5F7DA7|nr:SDR family oxidoreductase [Mucilaginibacter rivuli]MBW4890152.1 SDR family oxidoreductase [Mucilaginibacter rivuli]
MKDLVLITGASTGIGYEMAKILAERKFDLVLVARTADKLEYLKQEFTAAHAINVRIIVKDLSKPENAVQLYEHIKSEGLEVTMLVNNAGMGVYGDFVETPLSTELQMIGLNISSLVTLTKLFGHDMRQKGYGRIMNVASLLSFLPFPYYSVYSATKAFVLAFSETVAAELEGTGVIVTALCPGPVDTQFTTTEMLKTNAYKTNKPIHPSIVAKAGVDLLTKGKGKKIVGFTNWIISNLPRVMPDFFMMKIKKKLAKPTN